MGAHVLLPDAPVTEFDYQAWAVAAAHPELIKSVGTVYQWGQQLHGVQA